MSTQTFMVVATIREDTDLAALTSLIPDEMASVERLREQGKPVSYTHLDVYKRQVLHQSPREPHG